MIQTSTKRRNILIASIIIVVLVISLIGALVLFQQLTTNSTATKLSVNVSPNQNEVLQGSNLQATVNVTSTGNIQNVTLSSNVGLSGIHCSFEPATGMSNFTSLLTMSVPDSVPTGNYSVIVIASSNDIVQNASFIASVLSAKVTVSGIINVTYPSQVAFTDLQTNLTSTFQFPLTESTLPSVNGGLGDAVLYSSGNSYSVTLLNQHTYNVTVSDKFTFLWSVFTDTFQASTLYVYAPAGNNTMSNQNFGRPST